MITRKRMAQHIRWPAPETNLTPQRTPAALPVTGNRQKPAPLKQPTRPPQRRRAHRLPLPGEPNPERMEQHRTEVEQALRAGAAPHAPAEHDEER